MRQLFIQKCVSDSLICLGLNLSGCREIFSSWRQRELKLNCYIYLNDFVSLVTCFLESGEILERAIEFTYDVKFRCLFPQSLKHFSKLFSKQMK